MTQPSFVTAGNFDWDTLPQGYTPTDEDIQYFKNKLDLCEKRKDDTIKQLVEKIDDDPELLGMLIQQVNENHEWFIAPYQKQLAILEDAITIYRLTKEQTENDFGQNEET